MLQAMLDAQEELAVILKVPFDEHGLLAAAIGMVEEAAELLSALYVGQKVWDEADVVEADKEAIDVLMYVLEYLVIRDYDSDDIINMYYKKVETVTERVATKAAHDKVATPFHDRGYLPFDSYDEPRTLETVHLGVEPDMTGHAEEQTADDLEYEEDIRAGLQRVLGDDVPPYEGGPS